MKNYTANGSVVPFIAAAAIASGDPVLDAGIFGVATGDVASGDEGVLQVVGVFELPKKASQAWSNNVKVYWDDTEEELTTTATGNTLVGTAYGSVAGGASDVLGEVRLSGVS